MADIVRISAFRTLAPFAAGTKSGGMMTIGRIFLIASSLLDLTMF
jgi:hypothetical protein